MMSWLAGQAAKWGISAGMGWVKPLIYALIAAAIFSAGWVVRDWKCDAAFYKAENLRLNSRIEFLMEQGRKQNEAAKADQEQGVKDAEQIAELETKMRELENALPAADGACLDPGVVERLRKLWQ